MSAEGAVQVQLRRLDRSSRKMADDGLARAVASRVGIFLDRSESVLRALSVLLAILAMAAFLLTDADGGRGEPGLWLQIMLEAILAVGLSRVVRLIPASVDRGTLLVALAFVVLMFSLLWEPVQRVLLGSGRPFEMMMMHSQKNLMLVLAAAGQRGGLRLSVFIGAVLCIFSSAITRDPRVWLVTAVFAVTALSWLVAAYWSGLRPRMLQESGSQIPLRWAIAGPLCGLLLLLAGAGGGPQVISSMRGFLPGSGGDGGYDEFARGGVNDGDALVAGQDDIRSFGAIEDAPFAESDRSSLYDVINDAFDEPVRRNKEHQQAVSLPPELMAALQQRLSSVQEAGREFSTHRRHSAARKSRAASISSATLLAVSGRVPLHLRMELYDLFDGRAWHPLPSPADPLQFSACVHAGKPWIRIPSSWRGLSWESWSDYHVVTPLALKSPVIPAPLDTRALHIDRVDRADLFGWHQEGIVRMSRASLEAQAAIHLRSEVMDQVSLRRNGDLVFETTRNSESRLLPVGESMDRIAELANSWTVGLPRGMVQIDEICRRLREGYVLDREWVSGEDVLIPVEDFLFGSRRGPEYQFATAAVVMLRSLGYTARLVSGFYADPENYDPRKRKTLVRAENSHFWCEVFVGGGTWATLEPSPGYEILEPPPTFGELLWSWLLWGGRWMLQHWLFSGCCVALVSAVWLQRRFLWSVLQLLNWLVFPGRTERERILRGVRLIDQRWALAGLPRPQHLTAMRWSGQFQELSGPALRRLLRLAELALHGGMDPSVAASRAGETGKLIRQAIAEVKFSVLRRLAERYHRERSSQAGTQGAV